MIKRKRNYFFSFIIVIIFFISIGFAILQNNLYINGYSNIESVTWDIHFSNVILDSGSSTDDIPVITSDTVTFSTNLNLPGDYYSFTVDIVNDGTITATIDSIEIITDITEEQKKFLNYNILYNDGSNIEEGQLLLSEKFKTIVFFLEFKSDVLEEDIPKEDLVINFSYKINYVQADKNDFAQLNIISRSWADLPGISLYDAVNLKYDEMSLKDINNYPRATEFFVTDLDSSNTFIDASGRIINLKNLILEAGKTYDSMLFSKGAKIDEDKIAIDDYLTIYVDVSNIFSGELINGSLEFFNLPVFMHSSDTYINVVHATYPSGLWFANPTTIEGFEQELIGEYILGFPSGQNSGCGSTTIHRFFLLVDEDYKIIKITDNIDEKKKIITSLNVIEDSEMTWEEAKIVMEESLQEILDNGGSIR